MSSDLVQRLREEFLVDPSCSSGEAADRIDRLEAENDELHDDVLTALRVRNAALTRAAAHFHPGTDAADDTIRQSLIEEWVTDGHEQVAEENRQRTQMLQRMLAAEAERDKARAENTKLRKALGNLLDCVEEGPFSSHEQCGSAPAARALLADTEEADDA